MILCLDYGSRYIGVAATDKEERMALRHSVIDQKESPALPELKRIVEGEGIEKILVGVPISLSGNESKQTHITRAFIEKLQQYLGETAKIEEVDETLTSIEADRRVKNEGGSGDEAHAEAARIMLEEYLKEKKVLH